MTAELVFQPDQSHVWLTPPPLLSHRQWCIATSTHTQLTHVLDSWKVSLCFAIYHLLSFQTCGLCCRVLNLQFYCRHLYGDSSCRDTFCNILMSWMVSGCLVILCAGGFRLTGCPHCDSLLKDVVLNPNQQVAWQRGQMMHLHGERAHLLGWNRCSPDVKKRTFKTLREVNVLTCTKQQ